MSLYNCKMTLLQYLKRNDKPKVTLPSKLISLSEHQLQQVNDHIWKTEKVTTSGIGKKRHHQYNEYSAKERADIGKYSAEMLWVPYPLHHVCNTCTLKLF